MAGKKKERKLVAIHDLFAKYRNNLEAPEQTVKDAFCDVVDDLFSIRIPSERVSYNVASKTLSLAVSGALKTEIKVRQDEILTHLKGRLGAKSAPKTIL